MKPASSFRTSLVTGCALFALCSASCLHAADAPQPSIEIHLDVLSHLDGAKPAAPLSTPAPAKTAKAKPHHAAVAKTEHKPQSEKVAAAKPAAKTQHAKAEPRHHAKTKIAEKPAPKPEVKTAAEEALPPAPAVDALPPQAPPPKVPPSAESAPPAAPGATDVPKLPEADMAGAPKPAAKEGALSGITGGIGDILSGPDNASPPAPAALAPPPAPKSVVTYPPAAPASVPETPPKLAHEDIQPPPPAPSAPNTPPPLSDKDLPSAPPVLGDMGTSAPVLAEAPPALSSPADAEKPAMAPGDLPGTKPDLPALPAPDKNSFAPPEPPKEMAQATLTPLPSSPPAAAAAPAPAAPPAAPQPPAPAVDTAGVAPDLRIAFNENETEVPLASTASLDGLAKTLHDNPAARVNIMAYASGPDTAGIYPKRVSLARGIAVRNYLTTTKGIDIERVNVKALGNKNTGGPGDRVDVFMLK